METPIEISEKQYAVVTNQSPGIVCGKIIDGKYYILITTMDK